MESTRATDTSILAFGTREGRPVVLKVIRAPGDEWNSGEVTAAFNRQGMVGVLEHEPGAVLLERLLPGTDLASLVRAGDDDAATRAIADVARRLHATRRALDGFVAIEHWGDAFERGLARDDTQLPRDAILDARNRFVALCVSQKDRRLLHGDLQHYNILHDGQRGWVAIDPKGVIGELECELASSLRNPNEDPELYSLPVSVERRVRIFSDELTIDIDRTLGWAYGLAWLSVMWTIEDEGAVRRDDPALRLVDAVRALIGG